MSPEERHRALLQEAGQSRCGYAWAGATAWHSAAAKELSQCGWLGIFAWDRRRAVDKAAYALKQAAEKASAAKVAAKEAEKTATSREAGLWQDALKVAEVAKTARGELAVARADAEKKAAAAKAVAEDAALKVTAMEEARAAWKRAVENADFKSPTQEDERVVSELLQELAST